MTDNTRLDNPLDRAAAELRDIFRNQGHFTARFNAGSLERMLVHLSNINRSVLATTRDHVNASKRLSDFALTLERIAKELATEDLAVSRRLTAVTQILKSAGEEIASQDAIPGWPEPVAGH